MLGLRSLTQNLLTLFDPEWARSRTSSKSSLSELSTPYSLSGARSSMHSLLGPHHHVERVLVQQVLDLGLDMVGQVTGTHCDIERHFDTKLLLMPDAAS